MSLQGHTSCTAIVATDLSVLSAEKEETSNRTQGHFTSVTCSVTRQLELVILEHRTIAMEKCFPCLSPEGLDRLVLLRRG